MMDSPVSATPETSKYKTWLRVQDFLPPSLCDSLCDDVENGKKLGLSCKNEENTEDEEANNETNGREKWETLEQVLEKGRLLLSSSGAQYELSFQCSNDHEKEVSMLSSLDTSAASASSIEEQKQKQNELLRKRVRLQRNILSRRLGLGGIALSNTELRSSSSDIISDKDLLGDMFAKRVIYIAKQKNSIEEQKPTRSRSARERNIKRLGKKRRMDSDTFSSSILKEKNKICKSGESIMKRSSVGGASAASIGACIGRDDDNNNDYDNDDDNDGGKKSTIRNLLLLSLHHQPDSGVGEK